MLRRVIGEMKKSSFYDLTSVPFSDRETFNNAILLLSMVKSEAYYLTGFSRLNQKIEIGFDFVSSYNTKITQTITMELSKPGYMCFSSVLKGIGTKKCKSLTEKFGSKFNCEGDDVIYKSTAERDTIIPISIENVDKAIKVVKKEIIDFIEAYFETAV